MTAPGQGELLPEAVPQVREPDWATLAFRAGVVFTPSAPVDKKAMFAGRIDEVRRVIDTITATGQHAVIFGERGVGKTSLANVLHEYLAGFGNSQIVAARVNCDGGDTFDSIWRKVFEKIDMIQPVTAPGFGSPKGERSFNPTELINEDKVTPDGVRQVLSVMARSFVPIMIFDEFDRLRQEPRRAFADMIKTLSDHAVGSTVVLVGVADTVDQLIDEHQSVARALIQIPMTRMSRDEIGSIIDRGLETLGMTVTEQAKRRIVLLARGLPHYAHLVALHATRAAADAHSLEVRADHVASAVERALQNAQQSIRNAYHKATTSPQKDNLFADVLLACALADADELGTFAAQDVRGPMRLITGRDYDIPSFAQHLNDFSDHKRGNVLQKTGEKRRYRYRFVDSLLQPYVIMQGVKNERVPAEYLESGILG